MTDVADMQVEGVAGQVACPEFGDGPVPMQDGKPASRVAV